jgi:hypothetical protein
MNCNNPNNIKPPGKTFGPGQSNGSSFVSLNLSNSILITYKHAKAPTPKPTGVKTSLSELINANAAAHPPRPGAKAGKFGLPTKSGAIRCEFSTPSAPKTKAKERFCCATAKAICGSIALVLIVDALSFLVVTTVAIDFLVVVAEEEEELEEDVLVVLDVIIRIIIVVAMILFYMRIREEEEEEKRAWVTRIVMIDYLRTLARYERYLSPSLF